MIKHELKLMNTSYCNSNRNAAWFKMLQCKFGMLNMPNLHKRYALFCLMICIHPASIWCSPSLTATLDSIKAAISKKEAQFILENKWYDCERQSKQIESEAIARVVGKRISSKTRLASVGGWEILYQNSSFQIPQWYFAISYAPDTLATWKVFVKKSDSIVVDYKNRRQPIWISVYSANFIESFEVAKGIRKKGEEKWKKVNERRIPKKLNFEICSTQPENGIVAPMDVFYRRPKLTPRQVIMPHSVTIGSGENKTQFQYNRYGNIDVSAQNIESMRDSIRITINDGDTRQNYGIGKSEACFAIYQSDSLCFKYLHH